MKKKTTAVLLMALCLLLGVAALLLAFRNRDARSGDRREPVVHTARASGSGTLSPSGGARFTGPAIPERETEAEPEYFGDAAFVGTSAVAALGLYDYDGLLRDADFYEVDTLADTEGYLNALLDGEYGKIYLGLGAEELVWNSETVRRAIVEAVEALQGARTDTVIYLMSITPVSEYRSASDTLASPDRVRIFNDMIYGIAEEMGVWYLDAYAVLSDEDGYLPADVTEDGVSFTPAHYGSWYELLKTHYIDPAG